MFDWFRGLCGVLYRRVKNVRRKREGEGSQARLKALGLSLKLEGEAKGRSSNAWLRNRVHRQHRGFESHPSHQNGDVPSTPISVPTSTPASKLDRFTIEKRLHQAEKKRKQPHDVGRFMKHGRQARWYRRSVKARVQPEEEND